MKKQEIEAAIKSLQSAMKEIDTVDNIVRANSDDNFELQSAGARLDDSWSHIYYAINKLSKLL